MLILRSPKVSGCERRSKMTWKGQGEAASEQTLRSLWRTLEELRSWQVDDSSRISRIEKIDQFIARLQAAPELYVELRTRYEELEWIREQEYVRELRYHVAVMREASPDARILPSTIRKIRELSARGVMLLEAGTSEEEIAAKERAYRVATARKMVGTLREEVYFSWMRLEEVDRRTVQIRCLLRLDKPTTDWIGMVEIGTNDHELANLRKVAEVREARRLLGEIQEQIQWDRAVGDRFGRLEILIADIDEGCLILGISRLDFEKLREASAKSRDF